jgi:membrane protease YdiL (CAAX protease family)
MPLLIALVYEKVLSITLYEAMLDHAVRIEPVRNHLDAWLHILIGLGMTVAVLLLVPLMGRVGFRSFLTGAQVRSGLYLQFFALTLTYAVLAGIAVLVGGAEARPTLLFPVGTVPLLLVIGQGARAMAEEFYYRGLLQRELTGLMGQLGVEDARSGRTAAIALISLGFGIEHFRFGAPLAESYQGFAYALAVGFLFGYLLVLTGNVFFCGLVHATNNYVTAHVMPKLGTPDGSLLVPDETILYLYLVVIFLLVFLAGGLSRGTLRRVLLPDTGRAVKT